MDETTVVFDVSDAAKEMVRKGLAKYESGGIRKENGELVELAKPILKKVTVNGVNVTKPVIDSSAVSGLMARMKNNNALSWVNAVVGMANCGITLVCYKKQMKAMSQFSGDLNAGMKSINDNIQDLGKHFDQRLDIIEHSLNDIKSSMDRISLNINEIGNAISIHEQKGKLAGFNELSGNLRFLYDKLCEPDYDITPDELNITQILQRSYAYLDGIFDNLCSTIRNDDLDLRILYVLGTLFVRVVELFEVLYIRKHGKEHTSFTVWVGFIEKLSNSDEIKKQTETFIMLSEPNMSPIEKMKCCRILNGVFHDSQIYLEANNSVALKLYTREYESVEEFIEQNFDGRAGFAVDS